MSCQMKGSAKPSCDAKFVKSSGIFTIGKYFCGEDCINDDVDVKQFNEMEEQNARLEADLQADLSEEGEIDL